MASTPSASALSAVLRFPPRDKLEIPGVLSVTRGAGRTPQSPNQPRINSFLKEWRRTKVKDVGLISESCVLFQSLRKKLLDTFCVCIVLGSSKSTRTYGRNCAFPLSLWSILKDSLINVTAAVGHTVRTKLAVDRTNQIEPDCEELSGCIHRESEPETWQERASEPEE